MSGSSRRTLLHQGLALAGTAGLARLIVATPARATPASMAVAIAKVTGGAKPTEGRITLDIPPLVENGNTVPMKVTVDSPMSEQDFVRAIHVFNEKNPQPNVISVRMNPRAGRAAFTTRIKLADTQQIIAIAEMSDGSFWSASADVIVTIAACLEDLP
jgi:sulfur-oxidizing protein SoxY